MEAVNRPEKRFTSTVDFAFLSKYDTRYNTTVLPDGNVNVKNNRMANIASCFQ